MVKLFHGRAVTRSFDTTWLIREDIYPTTCWAADNAEYRMLHVEVKCWLRLEG